VLNLNNEKDILNSLDPRRMRSKYIFLAILVFVFGICLDFYIFTDQTFTMSYIPAIILVGYFSRYLITCILLSGLITTLLQVASPDEWLTELFLLRWVGYFAIAFVIRTLVNNSWKEKQNLIHFTLTLSESIDARDSYTALHSKNVAYYSYKIGNAMNLSSKECTHLYIGGLLHDIGKIGISETILNKPSRLTKEEFEHIKNHPYLGFNMLKHVPSFRKDSILDMVLYHHEKYDGTGYPNGLRGKEIPLVARIMAVADAFDAMTSKRVYRETKDIQYALDEIIKGKHIQFDPEIADIFYELVCKEEILVRGNATLFPEL
jgi:HD-GYP domain-containing protein (c-di-GMP phosphodiesterase class II)